LSRTIFKCLYFLVEESVSSSSISFSPLNPSSYAKNETESELHAVLNNHAQGGRQGAGPEKPFNFLATAMPPDQIFPLEILALGPISRGSGAIPIWPENKFF